MLIFKLLGLYQALRGGGGGGDVGVGVGVGVCMGSSYRCIVACAHLRNNTGRRTATMAAPILFTSGLVKYEAVLHSCGTSPVGGMGTDL